MASNMFLVCDDLPGESQDSTHAGAIDILAWSWGGSTSATTHLGSGGGGGHLSIQDMTLTKYVDKSSPTIVDHLVFTKHIPEATLVVRKGAGETPLEYMKIKMNDVIVSSYQTGGSGGEDRLTETVSLNFSKYEYIYTPQATDGTGEAEIVKTFDIAALKA
jgi:type VI secretion system secreted protein Hcp